MKKWLFIILRLTLGAIILGSSIYKIVTPADFAHSVFNYQILPGWIINPVAIILPWVQFLCGGALIINRGTKGGAILILLMIITFQIAVASALIRGLNVACGCFEAGGSPATWIIFGRDSLILALAALVVWFQNRR